MAVAKIGSSTVYGNLKPRSSFTAAQQSILDAGGNVNGYAVVEGHYAYVGPGRTGQEAYRAVFGTYKNDGTDMGMTGNTLAGGGGPEADTQFIADRSMPDIAANDAAVVRQNTMAYAELVMRYGENSPAATGYLDISKGGGYKIDRSLLGEATQILKSGDPLARMTWERQPYVGSKGYVPPTQQMADRMYGAGSGSPGQAGADGNLSQAGRDAYARLKQVLSDYGLGDLADFVKQQLIEGRSEAEITQAMRETDTFKKRFPAIAERQKLGLPAISPGEYVAYERTARQMMRAAGLPEGFFDSNSDFTDFLVKDLSVKELGDRVAGAAHAMYATDPTDQAEWRRLGFGDGDIAALWLNPDVAQPLLEKRTAAAQISGTAVRAGFGGLSADEALGFAGQGVSEQQAQQGFGQLAHDRELFGALDSGEDTISRQEQLAAGVGGNAQAQARIEQRARRRKAAFSGGGGFAGGQAGLSGLGGSSA